MEKVRFKLGVLAIAFATVISYPLVSQAQKGGVPSMGDAGNQAPAQKSDPKEDKAYKAFHDAAEGDSKIQLGEQFDQKYPASRYQEAVEAELVRQYYAKQDWPKFYSMADKVLAKNADDATVLALVGWVIPRVYDANDPAAASKLDQAERYEKHALEVMETLQKPPQVSDADFAAARATGMSQAHSGLGMTYFRRQDFEDSAKELQLATQVANPDPTDLYVLGVDLQNLNRSGEAVDAFTKCSQMPGTLQDRCKQQIDAAKKAGPAK